MLANIRTELFLLQFAIQKYKIKIYRTTILPVVNKFETWSLELREENRLSVVVSMWVRHPHNRRYVTVT